MASEDEKTLADIVAEYRNDADAMDRGELYQPTTEYLRRLLDRIEAIDSADAWRSLYSHGNAAAMREALVKIRDKCVIYNNDLAEEIDALCANALSAPARNCDRFNDLKSAQRHYIEHGCPKGLGMIVDGEIRKFPWKSQFEKWLFAPAAERKGEGDGR